MDINNFTYIDLFSGIGGFHQAASTIGNGGACVFASDIDEECINVYRINYNFDSGHDVTEVDAEQIPPHSLLCGGFPCQAFSKAGKQAGVNDTRGTLFFEIERILRHHHPEFILLENVRNLVSHDGGNTWRTITGVLHDIGYRLNDTPIILSPHQFGVPQNRERVYIAGKYDPQHIDEPLHLEFNNLMKKEQNSIYTILEPAVDPRYNISEYEDMILTAWDEFYQGITMKTIGFPIWAEYFKFDGDLNQFPLWKKTFIEKNMKLYKDNKKFIDKWLRWYNNLTECTPTHRKFEWQCGTNINSVFEGIIQLRPSGIRVKTPDVAPALVALVQVPIIGRFRRRLSIRECARRQSFPDTFIPSADDFHAYKELGNSVNVRVLSAVLQQLIQKYN